ncbi:hypothetical protein EB796_012871 [Bugula neritina]|uniref:Uncharacterized protein n=1 Tax=Bugula neritina TaxID=10212 RepID=A0A7J7JSF9_BUGNE|nr:hypothetical protein EB796_012871 [Bugula neritina]
MTYIREVLFLATVTLIMVTVKRREQKVSDNFNLKVSGMSSRSTKTSCLLRTHTGCQTDVTKEKPSIRTTIAFTQTVVKETCGIAIQTNSKVSCDASSQISRSATHEIGSQAVITSTTNGNTQTYVASAQNKKTETTVPNTQDEKSQTYIPSAQNENTQTDVAVDFQTTGNQSKHFY